MVDVEIKYYYKLKLLFISNGYQLSDINFHVLLNGYRSNPNIYILSSDDDYMITEQLKHKVQAFLGI